MFIKYHSGFTPNFFIFILVLKTNEEAFTYFLCHKKLF